MILAIQTSSAGFGLGLLTEEGRVLHDIHARAKTPLSRNLGDLFRALLDKAGAEIGDIDRITVDLGPGGLSSTRAGVSFGNALAYATGADLSGVSALDLLMIEARAETGLPICCMRPAQGGLAFWSLYIDQVQIKSGCADPARTIEHLMAAHGALAVVGPLARLKLAAETVRGAVLRDIDPPGLEGFALAHRRAPLRVGGIAVLEPITSSEGLVAAVAPAMSTYRSPA